MRMYKYRWYDSLRIPCCCAPGWVLLQIILLIVMKMLPAVQIFATAAFIDGAVELLYEDERWENLILPVVVLAIIIVISNLGTIANDILKQLIGNRIRSKFVDYLTVKCAKIRYAEIENHEAWNLIHRVKTQPDLKMEKGFESLLNLSGIFIQAGSLIGVLLFRVWWSVPFIVIIGSIVIYFALRSGEEQYDAEKNVAEDRQRYEYYGKLMMGRDSVEERRVFGFFPMLQTMWEEHYYKTRNEERKVIVRYLTRIKLVSSSMELVTVVIAAMLLYPLSIGVLSAGIYISLIQAANGVVDLMSWELSDYISQYARYKEYIKDVIMFSNLAEVEGALDTPAKSVIKINEVEFKNVSFTYPDTDKKILKNVSFKISAGHHYAIVGGNGAGKTTMIKLLTGLYPEFEGDILINNTPIQQFSAAELKAMLAVLFQDFARYEISVEDNVALGNIRDRGTVMQHDAIEKALFLLGMDEKIKTLCEGVKTQLGKLRAGGEELSGGEWQRLAMARAVISPADLLILDEPTAALDPLSESSLYEEFGKISGGRTTLFISHRLGSTMLADEIIVLDQGMIIGQGNHENLIEDCPLYRQMYESQRSWYAETI